ncbi:general stress protein [Bacillus sp. CECT 9360]|uniref:general stress protein n=1 Tax=Bacillus sp. CECT 9360 TaxID=2845821 RepID=UPI001E641B0A|nr:general stress protein [Bacillus sp. CECT 9360]CAH0346720.1 hypothetical protein BCI9360_03065 [Bacillus sp. CECT 9360]
MDRNVYGVFNSSEEVMNAVRELMERGFEGSEFTVIARDEKDISFTNDDQYIDVSAITTHAEEEDSFMDKVLRYFKDVEDNLEDNLTGNGLSEMDAKRYADEIEAGKIVVLVNGGKEDGFGRTLAGTGG